MEVDRSGRCRDVHGEYGGHRRRLTLPASRQHPHNSGNVPGSFVTDNPGYEPESLEKQDSQDDVSGERDEDISEHVAKSRRSRSLHLVHRQGRVVSESSSERPDISPGLGRINGALTMEKEQGPTVVTRGSCVVHDREEEDHDMVHDREEEDHDMVQDREEEDHDISRDEETEAWTALGGVRARSVGSIAQALTQERSTSIQAAEVAEGGTQTRLTTTQNIETQTSVDTSQQQQLQQQHAPPTTVAVIETYHSNNGAIPKHSRKKSLPEAAYLPRMDTAPAPYQILNSPPAPKMRPRPNTYSEVNSRPHSSISMVYTDTWPGQAEVQRVSARGAGGQPPPLSEAAARTERLFHTLERESVRVGRHPHSGALGGMGLVTRGDSGDSLVEGDQVMMREGEPLLQQTYFTVNDSMS